MIIMEKGASFCANGINSQNGNKKDSVMQRIRHQQNILNVLEKRYAEANNKHDNLLEQLRRKSDESKLFLSSLCFCSHRNEKDLKSYLLTSGTNEQLLASTAFKFSPFLAGSISNPDLSKSPSNDSCMISSSSLKRSRNHLYSDLTQIPVDPAVELILSRFLQCYRSSESQISSNKAELQQCKFTEDSQNGKRMMSRLRVLEKENAELEALRESGRPAKVNSLIALRRRHLTNLQKKNIRYERLLDDVESEVVVFTNTLTMLQQQLAIANATIDVLAVALASACPSTSTDSSSSSSYHKCVELLDSAEWPIPESLRAYHAASLASSQQQHQKSVEVDGAVQLEEGDVDPEIS